MVECDREMKDFKNFKNCIDGLKLSNRAKSILICLIPELIRRSNLQRVAHCGKKMEAEISEYFK